MRLGLLDDKRRARFAELAVLREDADIRSVSSRGCGRRLGLGRKPNRDLLVKLFGLSLLLSLDLGRGTSGFTIRSAAFFRTSSVGADCGWTPVEKSEDLYVVATVGHF
jgi:hypothetical protein